MKTCKKTYTKARVAQTKKISDKIYSMTFSCPEIAKYAKMGQFINIYLDKTEMILPRPISIQNVDKNVGEIEIMYLVVGKGTDYMAGLPVEYELNIAGPLGNGFSYNGEGKLALIGGGIGVPPLYYTARQALEQNPGAEVRAYIGFRDKTAVVLEEELKALGIKVIATTDDGSYGTKGNALEAFRNDNFAADSIFTCGPHGMLRAIAQHAVEANIPCQVSMEERMGCGIGACVVCAIAIKNPNDDDFTYKRVCEDGPVFDAEEVVW